MSHAWLCIPSIRENGGTVPAWKAAGYKIAIVRQGPPVPEADIEIPTDRYLGWAKSVNMAVRAAMKADPDAQWFVGGGDDTLPDPKKSPDEIAHECGRVFGDQQSRFRMEHVVCSPDLPQVAQPSARNYWSTFGVMQPTGDLKLWPNSRIDNFAGSPWMGREWCERAYGGNGPLDERFHHMFGDEALMCVAIKHGAFLQRKDLIHQHNHWARVTGRNYTMDDCPEFGKPLNSPEHWKESKALFDREKAARWPGTEPLATDVQWNDYLDKSFGKPSVSGERVAVLDNA